MKITYLTGDMVRSNEHCIVHGCNAQGVMGSGIAKQIRADYPHAYEVYRDEYADVGLKVGKIIPVLCMHEEYGPKVIINAITQEFYGGKPGVLYVSYEGVRNCLKSINDLAKLTQEDSQIGAAFRGGLGRIAFPLIGAGLAGGNWDVISTIIEEESANFEPVVYLFDGKMPEARTADQVAAGNG